MIYIQILIGHVVGDWWLQNTWIGIHKQKIKVNILAPVFWLHIFIVTLVMGIFTWWWDWRLLLVAFSHAFIDYIKYPVIFPLISDINKRALVDQAAHLFFYFLIALFL